MIDLHSHVLPELDDGSQSMEESLQMLRMAAAAGTTDIAATPHANHRYAFDPSKVEQKLAELTRAAGGLPRLHYGCEMHLTPENIDCAVRHPDAWSIGRRGYLLVEMPERQIPPNIDRIFGTLMSAGLRPMVAHPERNPLLQTNYRQLEEWVEWGCILQVTAQSFLGSFGEMARASAAELVQRGLAHVAASDGHDPKYRPPILDEARRRVEEKFGGQIAERLFLENPGCILDGRPVGRAIRPVKKSWWRRNMGH